MRGRLSARPRELDGCLIDSPLGVGRVRGCGGWVREGARRPDGQGGSLAARAASSMRLSL